MISTDQTRRELLSLIDQNYGNQEVLDQLNEAKRILNEREVDVDIALRLMSASVAAAEALCRKIRNT